VPWPYRVEDAQRFLSMPRDELLPNLLITERTDGPPRLVGSCSLTRKPSGLVELGYWVARSHWNRGIATEACEALLDIARILGLAHVEAAHFLDNPASGRVLEKLGFEPTGITAPRMSCARGTEVPARLMRLTFPANASDGAEEALAA
jgi:RimJ/RimL family protein N-acetyltransferase